MAQETGDAADQDVIDHAGPAPRRDPTSTRGRLPAHAAAPRLSGPPGRPQASLSDHVSPPGGSPSPLGGPPASPTPQTPHRRSWTIHLGTR